MAAGRCGLHVRPESIADSIVGIGTGSTANCFIDLTRRAQTEIPQAAVASSEAFCGASAHALACQVVIELNAAPEVTIYIDGADEANPISLQLIKGGGAALTREKIVTAVASEFVCIADESKWVDLLGTFPLPVEVIPMARSLRGPRAGQAGRRSCLARKCALSLTTAI